MITATLLLLVMAQTPPEPAASPNAWHYVLPEPGDPLEHTPLRAIALGAVKPDDVLELAHYRGTRQRYAQIRYGSPGSVRITVVLDEVSPSDVDLYVDADRNRRIEDKDRVAGQDRTWRLQADVATVAGEITRYTRRALIFRRGVTGLIFSVAAAGYVEGQVKVASSTHAARRQDGDCNGSLSDNQDRIWIDLNDDGRWDPASEQFLYSTILALGETRFAMRSDALGTRLALEPFEGTGKVKLAMERAAGAPRIAELSATLVGSDGSAVSLSGEHVEAVVPIGEYRVHTVTVAFEDPAGGPRWSFVFSDDFGLPARGWQKVERDGTTTIDPIGKLDFQTGVDTQKPCHAGDTLSVQPKLYTCGGLLINTCFRGSPTTPGGDDGPAAESVLRSSDGTDLGSARSGFA